jgi:hypothetical protein
MNKEEIKKNIFGFGVNSFNRFPTFLKINSQLKGENYWYALRNSYVNSDNLYSFSKMIKKCFLKNEPQIESLMLPEEMEYFNNLPNQITIYRGMTEDELNQKAFGCSWTLKKEVAEYFAYTYSRNFDTRNINKVVHELTINKNEVIAFFNEREEFEIIYIKTKTINNAPSNK